MPPSKATLSRSFDGDFEPPTSSPSTKFGSFFRDEKKN